MNDELADGVTEYTLEFDSFNGANLERIEGSVSLSKVIEVLEKVLDNHPNSQEFIEDVVRELTAKTVTKQQCSQPKQPT